MKQVKSLDQLMALVQQRKAVVTRNRARHPAAFIVNWPAHWVLQAIKGGLHVYEPKRKKNTAK